MIEENIIDCEEIYLLIWKVACNNLILKFYNLTLIYIASKIL